MVVLPASAEEQRDFIVKTLSCLQVFMERFSEGFTASVIILLPLFIFYRFVLSNLNAPP